MMSDAARPIILHGSAQNHDDDIAVIPGALAANLGCAIAHRGISRDHFEIPGSALQAAPE
jgi:hypothetical protein